MNAITKTNPADAFRAKATGLMIECANMTLHQLVDEFQRLTDAIDANSEPAEDGYGTKLNEAGEMAARERRLVSGTARARFGISFEPWDRISESNSASF
ncbi:hypothetical protein EVB98_039 [Rhizobium phage RHph_N3_2]|nr:hypothetical protein EVB98_039 [Rhizobium phage RHph_N3_2]